MIHKPGYIAKIRKNPTYYCRNCGKEVDITMTYWDHQNGYLTPEVHCAECENFIVNLDDIPKYTDLPKIQGET